MTPYPIRLCGAVAVAAALAALGGGPAAADWNVYRSASAGFSAAFPAKPTIKTDRTKSGRPRVVFRLDAGSLQYRISSQKVGPAAGDPQLAGRIYSAVRRNLLAKKNYSLVSERAITQPVRGRELVLRIQARQTVILTLRVYVVRDRFYQIIFGSDEARRNDPSGPRFLQSFRITYR